MRRRPARSSHRNRSLIAAPVVAGALALVAAACGSSSPAATGTTTATGSPTALLAAGLAAQKSGDITTATVDYQKVISLAPSSTTAAFANYDLGVIAQVDQNNSTAAESYYRAALAVNPNFVNALYNLAILVTSSDPLNAENYYQQVISLDPSNADAHLNLGFVYNSQGQKALARAQFNKAIALQPSLASRIPAGL